MEVPNDPDGQKKNIDVQYQTSRGDGHGHVEGPRVTHILRPFQPRLSRAWCVVVDTGGDDRNIKAPVDDQSNVATDAQPCQRVEEVQIHEEERGLRECPYQGCGPIQKERRLDIRELGTCYSKLCAYNEELVAHRVSNGYVPHMRCKLRLGDAVDTNRIIQTRSYRSTYGRICGAISVAILLRRNQLILTIIRCKLAQYHELCIESHRKE
jgi:hypothetical protein